MKQIHIYILVDPRTDEIRYVGKTERSLATRISNHMNDTGKCHRVNWLNELKAQGLKPRGVILTTIELFDDHGEEVWKREEKWWIRKLKEMGARLTNNTIGGDGVTGLPPETRAKMRMVWLGRKHKPETIEKLKKARALRVTSQETREKMSKSQTGRAITWGDKLSDANRKLSKQEADNILQRIKNGETVTAIAKEKNMHRTSISKIKKGTYFNKCKS